MSEEDPKVFYKKLYMKQWREKHKEHVRQYEIDYSRTHKEQRREAVNRRNRLNPQKNRNHVKQYRLKYPERVKEQRHNEYLKHKPRYIENCRNWQNTNREKYRLYIRQYQRIQSLEDNNGLGQVDKEWFVGAKCWINLERKITFQKAREELFHVLNQHVCQRCGFHDKRALQFDHINGGGTEEHKTVFRNKRLQFYMFYALNPELARRTLQVLCANCNVMKKYERWDTEFPKL